MLEAAEQESQEDMELNLAEARRFRGHEFNYTFEKAHFTRVLNFGEPQPSEKSGGEIVPSFKNVESFKS